MEFLLIVAIAGVVWAILSSRLRRLEDELKREIQARESSSELVASLAHRVGVLEKARLGELTAKGAPASAAAAAQRPTQVKVDERAPAAEPAPPPLVIPPPLPPPLPSTDAVCAGSGCGV